MPQTSITCLPAAEFLMGRSLTNAVYNLGVDGPYGEAIKQVGLPAPCPRQRFAPSAVNVNQASPVTASHAVPMHAHAAHCTETFS